MANKAQVTETGIDGYKANVIIGISLLIWAITAAIMVGSGTLNEYGYNPYSGLTIFVFLLPPIGAYLTIDNIINIWKVLSQKSS